MNELEILRKEIDRVDNQIVALLASRMDIVQKIGDYKRRNEILPLDEKRWQEVLDTKLKAAEKLNLSVGFVSNIYESIHKEALRVESETNYNE